VIWDGLRYRDSLFALQASLTTPDEMPPNAFFLTAVKIGDTREGLVIWILGIDVGGSGIGSERGHSGEKWISERNKE